MAARGARMRVIGGSLRGRRLMSPRWEGLRPTSDRLRETLFNVLGGACDGARVLDLCAGTGAVGIEALSRGAAHVTFVDADARACALIAANLDGCGVVEGYTVLLATIEQASVRLGGDFQVVFLDPPYATPALEGWAALAARLVAPGGVLVVEHDRRRELPPRLEGLDRTRDLRAGDSTLTFYRWPTAAPAPWSGTDGDTA